MEREPDAYVIERVRDALVHEPRAGVLDVDVTISAGKLFLTGNVGTHEARVAATELVGRIVSDLEIVNEMSVVAIDDADGDAGEELS